VLLFTEVLFRKAANRIRPRPGANPMIVSYNARAVRNYNVTSSLVHFETNTFSFPLKNALTYYNDGILVVNSEVFGLAPGTDVMILKIFSPKNFAEKIGVFDSKQS
jgi:hypothetical protein